MTITTTEDRFEHAKSNAKGWYETIKEQVAALRIATAKDYETSDCADREAAEQTIQEGPLSVQVRGGWRSPGAKSGGADEFEVLLSTGGPALRIWGKLGDHGDPIECELQMQDWFLPWTKWVPEPYDETFHDTLLAYASCFYFGE